MKTKTPVTPEPKTPLLSAKPANSKKVVEKPKTKSNPKGAGRKSAFTQDVVNKLEQIFSLDGSVEEACLFANISRQAYYVWIKKNPKLVDRFEALRNAPTLRARQELIKGLTGNPEMALKYLERKRSAEFAPKIKNEHSGPEGEAIEVKSNIPVKDLAALAAAIVRAKVEVDESK